MRIMACQKYRLTQQIKVHTDIAIVDTLHLVADARHLVTTLYLEFNDLKPHRFETQVTGSAVLEIGVPNFHGPGAHLNRAEMSSRNTSIDL